MKKLLIILLILISFNVVGSTRYIATNGNAGNDGTESNPLNFDGAIGVAQPGDIFLVKDGNYYASNATYNMLVSCSGNAGNYITFQSQNKWGAKILPLGTGVNATSLGIGGWNGASYIKFKDFEISGFSLAGFDLHQTGMLNSYWIIEGCKIHSIGNFDLTDNMGRSGVFIGPYCHHITVTKCIIFNIGRTGPDYYYMNKDHAIYAASPQTADINETPHDNKYSYNLMYKISGCPITMASNRDSIINNVIAWPNENSQGGNMMIYTDSEYCINNAIINNIFYGCVEPAPFAIWATSGTTGWSVKGNIVVGGTMWYAAGSEGWQSAMDGGNYGSDCENLEVDPLFINAVKENWQSANFALQSNSPAINNGATVGGELTDYLGNSLVGVRDIGAYEYQGTPIVIKKSITKSGKILVHNGKIITEK